MTRRARWFVGLVFTTLAGAVTSVAGAAGTDDASGKSAGRTACVGTASEAELRVDLGSGEGGVWAGDITLTVMGGTAEISGTVYDVDKLPAKPTDEEAEAAAAAIETENARRRPAEGAARGVVGGDQPPRAGARLSRLDGADREAELELQERQRQHQQQR